jgi:hypothetical protein
MTKQKRDNGRDEKGRFAAGTSGNEKGRPRKVKPLACVHHADLMEAALFEEIEARVDGRMKSITVLEGLVRSIVREALVAKGPSKLKYFDAIIKYLAGRPRPGVIEPFSWQEEHEKIYQELARLEAEERENGQTLEDV